MNLDEEFSDLTSAIEEEIKLLKKLKIKPEISAEDEPRFLYQRAKHERKLYSSLRHILGRNSYCKWKKEKKILERSIDYAVQMKEQRGNYYLLSTLQF